MIADINAGGSSGFSSAKQPASLPQNIEALIREIALPVGTIDRANMVAVAAVICPEVFTGAPLRKIAGMCGLKVSEFKQRCASVREILAGKAHP